MSAHSQAALRLLVTVIVALSSYSAAYSAAYIAAGAQSGESLPDYWSEYLSEYENETFEQKAERKQRLEIDQDGLVWKKTKLGVVNAPELRKNLSIEDLQELEDFEDAISDKLHSYVTDYGLLDEFITNLFVNSVLRDERFYIDTLVAEGLTVQTIIKDFDIGRSKSVACLAAGHISRSAGAVGVERLDSALKYMGADYNQNCSKNDSRFHSLQKTIEELRVLMKRQRGKRQKQWENLESFDNTSELNPTFYSGYDKALSVRSKDFDLVMSFSWNGCDEEGVLSRRLKRVVNQGLSEWAQASNTSGANSEKRGNFKYTSNISDKRFSSCQYSFVAEFGTPKRMGSSDPKYIYAKKQLLAKVINSSGDYIKIKQQLLLEVSQP